MFCQSQRSKDFLDVLNIMANDLRFIWVQCKAVSTKRSNVIQDIILYWRKTYICICVMLYTYIIV